ncbi:FAD-dependent oxidoreductase [Sedimentibacter hydroxybenzoicus DSM 7310]|uniref:FAD-dependent oxidoreductase n=1 Tax=Sedimentibacter hydroxybenzoicus DSM 7310 TaxID=1123245 RepID=A0A974BLU9_SEDHY|nr:FAD-dependent oxidoreductase [Sedimentibacter hydroxybenzoicus]NYB75765.1 FAD-dependent oxidoreductase [Sedimentibacter hydroxybenzoicus DSM 7310]
MSNYENLSKPITFRGMTVKNRVFLPPMKTNYITNTHEMSDEIIQYYEAMARGGVGLITTEAAEVDGEHLYDSTILGIYDDLQITGFKKLADALHQHGTKLSVQLIQGGPFANSKDNEGRMPLSSSPIAHVWNPMETPTEMTQEDIQRYIGKYVAAAKRAKAAGCDAVEIHCAHGHALLGSFLSPLVNHRTDEYGGDIIGRTRFLVEVIEAMRKGVGEDFPISVRLSADECEEGGNTVYDTAYIARLLESASVDYIHFSNGTLYDVGTLLPPTGKPRALNAVYTDIIKKAVNIPIGIVGRIKEPWMADMLIEQGNVDFVYIGRALICDPEFVKKSFEGRFDDVCPCIGCLTCLTSAELESTMQCTMNPSIAKDKLKHIEEATTKKNIVVIGGGPAGIEAATTAAKRGHNVTLLEKASVLGGQFRLASFPPVKQELSHGLKYMIRQLKKTNVDIRLDTEANLETVKVLRPDEIIVASGGTPLMPRWITKSGHPNVVSAWDIIKGNAHPGLNVLIIGGGSVGCETAEFISDRHNYNTLGGRKITLIEMQDNIDAGDYTANRDYLMSRIKNKPIDIVTNAKVSSIQSNTVSYVKTDKETVLEGIDTIIVAMGTQPANTLAEELKELSIPIHVIGDANSVGKLVNAIADGRELSFNL